MELYTARDVRPKGNETLSEKIKLKRGSRLYSWLLRNKYKTDEFVFLDVEYKDGVSVKEKLDLLYSQYYNCNAKKSKKNNSSVTDEIEKHCSKYGVGRELEINPQNEQERKYNSSLIDEIEKYCSKYAEWPELKINPQNEQERKI